MARRRRRQAEAVAGPLSGDALEIAETIALWGGDPRGRWQFDPPAERRISSEGAWIVLLGNLPPLEGGIDTHLTAGRVFYALHRHGCDTAGFDSHGHYRVRVPTPWGEVQLWPYEYAVLSAETIIKLWESGDLRFNPTAIEEARLNEIVFYAMSRGIARADAAVMALGSIHAPVGWFEPTLDVAGFFQGWGSIGGGLTAENHRRRAGAH